MSKSQKSSMTDMAKDVFKNSIAPVNVGADDGMDRVLGNAQVIAVEVAFSKIIRWVLKASQRSVMDLAFIHLISMGFVGGFAAPFDAPQAVDGNTKTTDALQDGLKRVPGVFAAQYVVATARKGLHLGIKNISVKDLLITTASKALTRPFINMVYPKLPQKMATGIDAHESMVHRQIAASRLKSDK